MRVILWMTVTLNGIIATLDYNEDFSSYDNWNEFVKAVEKCGCLIWGRKTYDLTQEWNKAYLKTLNRFTKVILSSNSTLKLKPGFTLAGSPQSALRFLENKGYKEVILTGGSKNNTSFAKLGLIDEVIVDIEPIILGKGIHLFDPAKFGFRLSLLETKKVSKDIIQLHYKVIKNNNT